MIWSVTLYRVIGTDEGPTYESELNNKHENKNNFAPAQGTVALRTDLTDEGRGRTVIYSGDLGVGLGPMLGNCAFDCVNHETLILKLHHYGVTSRALDLLASYLTNRIQKVDVNNGDPVFVFDLRYASLTLKCSRSRPILRCWVCARAAQGYVFSSYQFADVLGQILAI
ncbi:hypothetical protein EVAR_67288_1 [Eumeta japonica]|uniref:Uncharacterized protein n=1 Tax=Eumeta variegata TaxID=151549 RepID=A0A4C1ZWH8_EUMVA|nr:hypothetical protein EVAR_67288_1 [Eumeta japonica]